MSRYGYGNVPAKGFLSVLHDLSEGPWKDISIKKFDHPDHTASPDLLDASQPIAWKLRLTWALSDLRDTIGVGSELLGQLDAYWDSAQRKLNFLLGLLGEDKDKDKRDAAARLRDALLLGNGIAQTILSWEEEVDFGRQQVALTARGALADDAKKVDLLPALHEIGEATEALARGIGRGPGPKRAGSRYNRIRDALADCAAAFNGVHNDLEWFIEHTAPSDARTRLEQMLAPLQALLDRYPGDTTDAATAPTQPAPPPVVPAPAPA